MTVAAIQTELEQPCFQATSGLDEGPLMECLPVVELVDEPLVEANDRSLAGLTELLLKNPARVDSLTRDQARQPDVIPRFLAIGLASFSLYAIALALVIQAAPVAALPSFSAARWIANPVGSGVGLWLAYALGFTIATGVCLPSFYFYGLLAGVKVSWLQVTAQIMTGKASTAVMLMGLVPIYIAFVLGSIIFHLPPASLRLILYLGLLLPFWAGGWGVRSIYYGFMGLADTLPPTRRCRRECFLRRLTLACSACYTAVTPVMIYRLWEYFADQLAGFSL